MVEIKPDCRCPYCEASIDAATGVGDPDITPKPEDFSVCVYCGGILIFNGDGYWERMPEEVFSTMAPNERELLARARSVVKRLRAGRPE